ncbi:hypothetical protein [Variovorax paradoxus]|uniref:hypothetical protein n=1 Tax=Variovorax paradoxus TaxID=34073 RepID=UPI00193256D8|nr:hypothetical protein INQ48_20550 [Variovorax paradoxus]
MPNRIIREGILTSSRMAKLGWAEEVFYRRLLSVVDDFGRYYADHGLLRAACYPRQLGKVSDSDIGKWLRVCADAALVRVYPAQDGESYLEVLDFGQQVRAKKSKFPDPLSTCAAVATQPLANDHLGVSVSVSESVLSSPAGSAPAPASDLFDEFWKAYPNKVGKDAARKAFEKRKPARALLDAMLSAIGMQRTSKQWTDDGGRYIPHPSTWLNEGRWQDEGIQAPGSAGAPLDPDSQPAIEAEGVRLGLGKWSGVEQFPIYKARVRNAQAAERGASGGLH